MMTHFFSTSAGFWEKVAIVVTLFWIPHARRRRAFLVAWFGVWRQPKRKQPGKAAFLVVCIEIEVCAVNICYPADVKNNIAKSIS
jgi:hypothetical protein